MFKQSKSNVSLEEAVCIQSKQDFSKNYYYWIIAGNYDCFDESEQILKDTITFLQKYSLISDDMINKIISSFKIFAFENILTRYVRELDFFKRNKSYKTRDGSMFLKNVEEYVSSYKYKDFLEIYPENILKYSEYLALENSRNIHKFKVKNLQEWLKDERNFI